jgi:soluble lytic murein transglycosylase
MTSLTRHFFFASLSVVFISHCTTLQSPQLDSAAGDPLDFYSDRPPDSISGDGSLLFQQAQGFDKFLRGKLSEEQQRLQIKQCQTTESGNPFCSGFFQRKSLLKLVEDKSQPPKSYVKKEPSPLAPQWDGGKISNMRGLRRAPIENLLKGISSMSLTDLTSLSQIALKETKCPNRFSVALAASLEDHIREKPNFELIANLYSQGGKCSRTQPSDKENYLTRAGLFFIRNNQFKNAIKVLRQVAPTDAFSGRALFWLAFSQRKTGQLKEAELTLTKLLARQPLSFHSLLASEELKSDTFSSWLGSPSKSMKRSKRVTRANAYIKQIEILKKYGFDFSSALLVEWTFKKFSKLEGELRLYLSSFADPPTAIIQIPAVLITQPHLSSRSLFEQLYPKPFFETFVRNSDGIDPYLLLAIARKESRFNPRAVSSANAQGLMQINPETAKKMSGGEPGDLFNPDLSIRLGARHLQEDLSRFNGQLTYAVAAYNAGNEAITRWIERYQVSDPILFMDLIPYRETREYTAFVLSNYFWYQILYTKNTTPGIRY